MEKRVLDFNVFIEQAGDGIYIANVSDFGGSYSLGKILEGAMERIKEAIEVYLGA